MSRLNRRPRGRKEQLTAGGAAGEVAARQVICMRKESPAAMGLSGRSTTSVSSLRLASTRSKTCSMYSVGASNSRLIARLNTPA